MKSRLFESRTAWLIVGVVFGVAVSLYWPTEQVQATSVDRSSKIALITANTTAGNSDAVFILDFVTGRLVGGAYSTNTGKFNQMYYRNLARDFRVSENAQYAIVPGKRRDPSAWRRNASQRRNLRGRTQLRQSRDVRVPLQSDRRSATAYRNLSRSTSSRSAKFRSNPGLAACINLARDPSAARR